MIAAKVRLVFIFLVLAGAGSKSHAQMALPSKFEVTPAGAASYTVPLQVPPGVLGMEPTLSLTYNSRGENGLLGVGWTLAGLSSITRCPRTSPQDGVKGAVGYDVNDRFCLDGKRLVLATGTYGAASSSYRTEIETFANITAMGAAGTGPQYFILKTREGLTLEYGSSVDSRIFVAGLSTVRTWSLNKVTDSAGNAQAITYGVPGAVVAPTTEYNSYPLKVDYTSNSALGLVASNSVEFAYAARPDVINGYRGGYPARTSVRLASITTKTSQAIVSAYTLGYAQGAGGRSTITSLTLCGAAGMCAPMVQFGIGKVTGSLFPLPGATAMPVTSTESSSSDGQWFSMDLNGDGLADLVHVTALSGVYRVWLSKGDGTFTVREYTTTADTAMTDGSWQWFDVNGDGRADLVHITSTPGLVRVWLSNGDGTFTITPFTSSVDTSLSDGQWLVADVDGDGLPDLLHLRTTPGLMYVWKSNGAGGFTVSSFTNTVDTNLISQLSTYWYGGGTWQVLDTNGDGLADLVHLSVDGTGTVWINTWKSNGNGTFNVTRATDWKLTAAALVMQIDVNGDGNVDLVILSSALNDTTHNSHLQVLTSKGDGTFDVAIPYPACTTGTCTLPDDPVRWGTWHVIDVNGDGLPDLVHTLTGLSSGVYWIYASNGDGSFAISQANGGSVDSCTVNCLVMRDGDFLGNGAPGFVHINGSTVRSAWFPGSQPANLITSIADGAGNVTSLSLSPLPAMLVRGSYVKDLAGDANTWTLATAIPVVESVRTNTGWVHDPLATSADRLVSYSYGSARVERNGRGFLGFSWFQSSDSANGMRSRSYFRQDFPYTGLTAQQGLGTGGDWKNVSLSTNTYGCAMPTGACSVAPGNRYFVYPAQIDTQAWDLDGTAMPRTRVINANPDIYGNLQNVAKYVLNPDGSATEYSNVTVNTFYNDPTKWFLGRLVKSVVASTGATVPAPVIPGSGNLPAAPSPTLPPPLVARILVPILELLLSD